MKTITMLLVVTAMIGFSATVSATDRESVAVNEGFNAAVGVVVPHTLGPIGLDRAVNQMIEQSNTVRMFGPGEPAPHLALHLKVIETSNTSELAYAWSFARLGADNHVQYASDVYIGTCEVSSIQDCAKRVVLQLEGFAQQTSHS